MRKPVVEYPPELLDDPSLPLSERVSRRFARLDLDDAAWEEAYGNVLFFPLGGMVPCPSWDEVDEPGWSTPGG